MHWTTVKLIALDRVEGFAAPGWAERSQLVFAEHARRLRREIPPHLVAAYDQLKAEHREPVVGVFQTKCGGCHTPLSPAALAHLSEEHEASRCEHCGRFIYVAGSRYVAPSGQAHQLTGSHGGK